MHKDNTSVKILFRFRSNVLEEDTVETMWADVVDKDKGLYKLDNIPFYAPSVSSDDIVFAEFDELEAALVFKKVVEFSGNSTVRVVRLLKRVDIQEVRITFESLGCISEKLNDDYFAMEIPAETDYNPIKAKLDQLSTEGLIDYEESCLSH